VSAGAGEAGPDQAKQRAGSAERDALQTILVGTDGSPASMDAVSFAIDLASRHRAQLVFVNVVRTIDADSDLGIDVDETETLPHEPTGTERAVVDGAVALAAASGVRATGAIVAGAAADAIARYGNSHDVDLVVVGCRGRGRVAGALLGSVSQGVLRKSTGPVLIVRGAVGRGRDLATPDAT
jgi:nucleotide-binding universal stress UspA family protein